MLGPWALLTKGTGNSSQAFGGFAQGNTSGHYLFRRRDSHCNGRVVVSWMHS